MSKTCNTPAPNQTLDGWLKRASGECVATDAPGHVIGKPIEQANGDIVVELPSGTRVLAQAGSHVRVVDEPERKSVEVSPTAFPAEESGGATDNTLTAQPPHSKHAGVKSIHSMEEVHYGSYALDALGLLSLDNLLEALRRGDDFLLTDLLLHLDGVRLAIEYDGGNFHTEEKIPSDVKKTRRLLAKGSDVLVLRLRVCAPPLEELEGEDRCLVVHVGRRSHMGPALTATAAALAPLLPELYAERLRKVGPERRPMADAVAREAIEVINKRFHSQMKRLRNMVCHELADHLINVHGVKRRLWTGELADGIARLQEMGMDNDDLRTFMCNSVAAAIGKQYFWEGIARLQEMGMDKDDIRIFMCNGVASAIGKQYFWEGISWLQEMGMDNNDLRTFMCDGVASAIGKQYFWDGIARLRAMCMDKNDLRTFMCNSVAAAIGKQYFWEGIDRLHAMGMDKNDLRTFMCDGVASAIGKQYFWEGIA
eukprot:3562236-Prymnesium_polylepis.1